MTLRTVLVTAAAALVLVGSAPGQGQVTRPNILLIQADDLGYGDLSVYGQTKFATPSIDRLAREGIRFTNYYAGSTVCAPSRASLMTGQHTGHVWIRGNAQVPLRDEDVTIAEALKQAGYRTALIGKWGLGRPGSTGQPDRRGFEYSFGFIDQQHAHRQFTDHLYRNAAPAPIDLEKDYVNDLFTREAAAFIEKDDRRPFFIYLNYTVPHAELRVPADSLDAFKGKFPETPFVNANADGRATGPEDTVSLGYRSQPTPHAAFAAMITRMDRDIGRLVELIDGRGAGRQTLVLFTSDNGPHQEGGGDPAFFNSSGGLRGIKRDLYEGGIRVPMIARWTGTVPAGRTSDHAWAHWDLFPTLAELAGADKPRSAADGLSMTRALRGRAQPGHAFMYWEFHERGFQQAGRMGTWKAVRLKKDAPLELYDLSKDLREQQNVAAQHPDVIARFEQRFKSERTDSPNWPIK